MHGRAARVDRPLTYAVPSGLEVSLGDIVRVPLGPRETFGFVISEPRTVAETNGTRPIAARPDGPRAFDADAASGTWSVDPEIGCSPESRHGTLDVGALLLFAR